MKSLLHRCAQKRHGGFTLVELMAVMAIMALLLAVTIPSIEGLNMSAGLSQGGQLFADEISLARQMASTRNITVEVRCIKIPTRSNVGYTGLQLWSTSSPAALSRVVPLPDGMAISQDTTKISTLFNTFPSTGFMPPESPLSGKAYVSLTISPSGMVGPLVLPTQAAPNPQPPNMALMCVGIVPASQAASANLPTNYAIVQLNPLTASTVVYRP